MVTFQADSDINSPNIGKSLHLGFQSSEEAMLAGIRVRPADLARLFGVTKQAVSTWVKDGRITLGVDNRIDPRVAVNRLIATGDPARLRAHFLKPLVTELSAARLRILNLERDLATAIEDADFQEESAGEFCGIQNRLCHDLDWFWPVLAAAPGGAGKRAIKDWLATATETGLASAGTVLDHLREGEEEGGEPAERSPLDISEKDIEI